MKEPGAEQRSPLSTPEELQPAGFVPQQGERLAAAIQFLTRVPIPCLNARSSEQYAVTLRAGVVYFPLVGGCIGIFTAAIFQILSLGLVAWIAALLALACEAILTGAFHEDAFADTFDALGGGWTREQVLEIMKDSRLGTYGTLALVLGTGIRAGCFVELVKFGLLWTVLSIVAASTLGRLAIVAMMVTTRPISDRRSQARDVAGNQTWQTLVLGLVSTLPFWFFWIGSGRLRAVVTVAVVVAICFAYRRYIIRRVGGTTGDLLGCSAYLTQLSILIGSCWDNS